MVGVRGTMGVALVAALMVVCALLAAPAFAEANARSGTLQYVDCDQVRTVVGIQYNARSGDREVRQELDITQEQRRECLGDIKVKDDVLADTIVKGPLPDTGGLPLLALAGCALVVTGAFSAMRVIGRR